MLKRGVSMPLSPQAHPVPEEHTVSPYNNRSSLKSQIVISSWKIFYPSTET
jgi:hypothetical protein